MQIIVTGHGNFASGIESTVKLLAGSIKNIKYIDFTEDMNEESLMKKVEEAIDISVICGCNVGSLLENGLTGLDKFNDSTELAQALIESTKKGIRQFGVSNHSTATEKLSDGI